MRASTEKLKVSLKGVGGREKGEGDGWMATPKTQKTKKIAQDVHTSERATLRNFFGKKAKKQTRRILYAFLFGSSEISLFVCLLFK